MNCVCSCLSAAVAFSYPQLEALFLPIITPFLHVTLHEQPLNQKREEEKKTKGKFRPGLEARVASHDLNQMQAVRGQSADKIE